MSFRIPRTNYEWDRPEPGVTEKVFDKCQDLWEGINGCAPLNTKFENTERAQVRDPRGDHAGRPMPRDAEFYEADNHGEWGPDTYQEPWQFGSNGPFGKDPYHGMGLPTRKHERSNANPALGNVAGMDVQNDPQDQGVGSTTP